jgi:hypothetical protein
MNRFILMAVIISGFICPSLLLFLHSTSARQQPTSASTPNTEGKVSFRFLECSGDLPIFLLENGTEQAIYAAVQRADQWKEWKKANASLGIHFIEYKPPAAHVFEDKSTTWDAPIAFSEIPPHTSVRYGVTLPKLKGEFRVRVGYTREYDILRRTNMGMRAFSEEDSARFRSSWEMVSSDIVGEVCR